MARLLYRLGRFAAHHRVLLVGIWLVLVILAVGSVKTLGAKTNNSLTLPGTDSQAAFDLLAEQFPPQQNGSSAFVLHVDDGRLTDDRYKPAVDATFHAIKANPAVDSVRNPVGKNAEIAGIISDDERTGQMPVLLNVGTGFITTELAEEVLRATAPARRAGIEVAVGGPIGSVLSSPETQTSEVIGNISAMVILALVFGSLVAMVSAKRISHGSAKAVLETMVAEGADPETVVREQGLEQISDSGELEKIVEAAIEANPGPAEQVRSGNEKAIGALVGAVMKETRGRADGGEVNRLIKKSLGS